MPVEGSWQTVALRARICFCLQSPAHPHSSLPSYPSAGAGDAPACCKAKAQEEGKPAPASVAITATDANAQAFIRKNEQAAAALMV